MLAFVLVGASHLPPAHTRRALLQPRSVHRLRGGLRTDSTDAADVHLGLRNQGNTCYMNSLLQALYHLPEFRRAVYRMSSSAEDQAGTSFPLELQRVFYQLQHGLEGGLSEVGTEQLTASFGWGQREV